MSLTDFYHKFKKKKKEAFAPIGSRVSSGFKKINKAKKSFDRGIGKSADKAFKSYGMGKTGIVKTNRQLTSDVNNFKKGKLGENFSRRMEKIPFFKPTTNGKVRVRDFVRELPKGVDETAQDVARDIMRFGISMKEVPETLKTGKAKNKFYNTPFGRVNSFQSEAQNRVKRGDSLLKAIGNPAIETVFAGGDIKGLSTPIINVAKKAKKYGKVGKEVANIADDLSVPLKKTRTRKVPARIENVHPTGKFEGKTGIIAPGGVPQTMNLEKPLRKKGKFLIPAYEVEEPFSFKSKTFNIKPGLTIEDVSKKSKVNQKFKNVLDIPKEEKLQKLQDAGLGNSEKKHAPRKDILGEKVQLLQENLQKEEILRTPKWDDQLESQYREFRAITRPKVLDEIEDADQFRKVFKNQNVDDIFHSTNKSDSEIFDMFKERRFVEHAEVGSLSKLKKERVQLSKEIKKLEKGTKQVPMKNTIPKQEEFNQYQQKAYKEKEERIDDIKKVLHHSPELQSIGYKKGELKKIGVDQEKRIVELAKLGYPKNQIEALKGDWERTDKIIKNNVSWTELKSYYDKKKKLETNFLEDIDPSTIKDLNPLMVGGRDVFRNLEASFGKNFPKIKARLLDPFDKAKGAMVREQQNLAKELSSEIVQKFGIKKGSLSDKAIVEFGEGKISLEKLKANFPKDWQNIVEADKWFRGKYSALLKDLNDVRESNFPTHPLYPESTKVIPERKDYYRHGKDLEGITGLRNMFETSSSIDPSLASSSDVTNPKSKWLGFAQKRKGDENDFGAVEGYINYIKDHAYAKHVDPFIQKFKGIDDEAKDMMPKNSFIPEGKGLAEELSQKMDPIQQIVDGGESEKIKTVLKRNGVSEKQANWLSEELAKIGDYKKVKSFLEEKLGKNKNDALGKLTNGSALAEKSENQANNLLVFIKNFSRDLAGKTNPVDRPFQENFFGRKALNVTNFLNSRFKANAVLGNLSSSIAQFFNIPQGFASAGVRNSAKGFGDSLAGMFKKSGPIKDSNFINERYFDGFNEFDTSFLDNTKKLAVWVTGIGDEIGTKFIWNSHYRKALSENVSDPVKYADDWTRKMVAGRGVGEVPIAQKAKIVQLIAPFQLEVANQWYALRDIAKNDPRKLVIAKKLLEFSVASFLMNRVAKEIRGSDVSFDPVNAMLEAYNEFSEEGGLKGSLKATGRLAGEALSNVPGGQTLASAYPEYGDIMGKKILPPRKEFFGEGDPTRFGTGGLPMFSAIKNPLTGVVTPYGGKQLEKTYSGIKSLKKGYAENKSGKVISPIENTIENTVKGLMFGKNALSEVKDYYDTNQAPLSDLQSEKYKLMGNSKEYFNKIKAERKANKERANLKIGKSEGESTQLSEGVFKLSNGKVYVQSLNREFDNAESAKRELVKDGFKNSDKKFMRYEGKVYTKTESGNISSQTESEYQSKIYGAKLTNLKKNKDLVGWMETAEKKLEKLDAQLQESGLDELNKIKIENEIRTLATSYAKYSTYGGFTKPKKGKKTATKYKYSLVDPEFLKIKTLLAGINKNKTHSKRILPLVFKKPKVVRRRKS